MTDTEESGDLEFHEFVDADTMPDAHDSADSALQYVAFDLLDAGYEDQSEYLDEIEESAREAGSAAFADAVLVAAKRGEQDAAKWLIGRITDEIDTDSPAGQRFAERLRQKEGKIAVELDAALTKAKRHARSELESMVIDWGEVV